MRTERRVTAGRDAHATRSLLSHSAPSVPLRGKGTRGDERIASGALARMPCHTGVRHGVESPRRFWSERRRRDTPSGPNAWRAGCDLQRVLSASASMKTCICMDDAGDHVTLHAARGEVQTRSEGFAPSYETIPRCLALLAWLQEPSVPLLSPCFEQESLMIPLLVLVPIVVLLVIVVYFLLRRLPHP